MCRKDSMKYSCSHILSDFIFSRIKILFTIVIISIFLCYSLNTAYSTAYTISKSNKHDTITSSYEVSPDKKYTDNLPKNSSNYYFVNACSQTFTSKEHIVLKITSDNHQKLSYHIISDKYNTIPYTYSHSKKQSKLCFRISSDIERFYIEIYNSDQSHSINYNLKLNINCKAKPSPQKTPKNVHTPKPDVTKKPYITKKPTATKKPYETKRPAATKKPYTTKKPVATKKPRKKIISEIKIKKIKLSRNFIKLSINSSYKLSYKITPSNASNKKVIWSSSNSKIASVKSGRIYAHKKGIAIIKITSRISQKTASCTVKVISRR